MITVMTIAGLDPSGGAGVLADIKTISAFGCYGLAAVTSITAQNTKGVLEAYHQSAQVVADQISALLDDFEVSVVKTGMLPTAAIVRRVAESLAGSSCKSIVVDPILRSTSGHSLTDRGALDALVSDLMPQATLMTPNAAEAGEIAGIAVNRLPDMRAAAEAIAARGARAVLVTGGDLEGDEVVDLLVDSSGEVTFKSQRLQSRNTHGTGCALSAAIACLLARGVALREAVHIARRYVAEAIRTAPDLGHGTGPINHRPPGFSWSC